MSEQADKFDTKQVTVSSSTPTPVWDGGRPKIGIQIKSLNTNTGIIYVGRSNITASNGYPLAPSESVLIPVDNTDGVMALAAVNNEKLCAILV
jgi:hypothetical protein